MKRALLMVLSIGVVLGSVPAHAGVVIYDNFDLGAYVFNGGSIVSGSNNDPYGLHTVADEFVAGASSSVTEIDVAFLYNAGDFVSGTVSLYTVGSDGAPDTSLGSWSGATADTFPSCCSVTTIPVTGGPTLTAGTSYFLVIAAGAESNTLDTWADNLLDDMNDIQVDFGTGWSDQGSDTLGAFSILGDAAATPEPGTMLLLGSVLVATFGRRRFFN